MPASPSPLSAYYRLLPKIRALEPERRKTWLTLAAAWAALIVPSLLLGAWLVRLGGSWLYLVGLPLVAAGLAAWLSPSLVYPFKYEFKRKVIRPMMKELLRDVDYAPLGSVSPLELEASLLFSAPFSGVEGEDLVVGRYEDVEVKFSEVVGYRLREQARGLGGGQRAPSKQVLFRGLFFVAEFNKPARGQVVVYPDALEGALGPLATALQPRRDPGRLVHVRMEDPRFERHYSVYASDPETAHYVLTPVLMERLAEFRRKVGAPVAFSVVYGKLYMAVASHKNLLEPPLFGPLASPKVFRGYLEDVGLFLSLVEELGLNRKIWGEGAWR
ncbi:DUF3137 domain-containing protein [Oceanithermus sp.]